MADPAAPSPRRRLGLILLALAELAGAFLALFFAGISVMMFDAPGSEQRSELWLLFCSTLAVPVALLVGTVFAAIAAWRYSRRRVMIALLVPGVAIGWLVVLYVVLGSAGG